jgi:hypothetical protein
MDIAKILENLVAERARLDTVITTLEKLAPAQTRLVEVGHPHRAG